MWWRFFFTVFFVFIHSLRVSMVKTSFFGFNKMNIKIKNDCSTSEKKHPSLSENSKTKKFEKFSYLTLYSRFDFSRYSFVFVPWEGVYLFFFECLFFYSPENKKINLLIFMEKKSCSRNWCQMHVKTISIEDKIYLLFFFTNVFFQFWNIQDNSSQEEIFFL